MKHMHRSATQSHGGAASLGVIVLLLLALASGVPTFASTTGQTQPAAGARSLLPLVIAGSSQTPPPPVTPTTQPTPGPAVDAGALFFRKDLQQYHSADVAVDGRGGVHLAFSSWTGDADGARPAFYAYCPAGPAGDCDDMAHWSIVRISDSFPIVQLALTPQGHPRMLLEGNGGDSEYVRYQYAACNSLPCTVSTKWQWGDVRFTSENRFSSFRYDYGSHYFALDPVGNPRFVYADEGNATPAAHRGAWYAFCDADTDGDAATTCTDGARWSETRLPGNFYVDNAALAFTPQGQPRLIGTDGDIGTGIRYTECNTACHRSSNWSSPLRVYDRGSGHASWTLAVDAKHQIHMALYQGATSHMFYVWCPDRCTSAGSWGSTSIGLEDYDGTHPAIALDAQGRPRIAYQDHTEHGAGYAWCTSSCRTAAGWRHGVIEAADDLNRDFPLPLADRSCIRGTWLGGYRPALALDPQGNPRLAFDNEHVQECKVNPDDPNDPRTFTETKWQAIRFAFFPQP